MPKYYVLVDENAEEPVYEEVELASLELPDDHPKIKELSEKEAKARDEAIKARKRYQKLREQIQRDADNGSDSQPEEEESDKESGQVFDPEKLYQEFASRLFNDLEEREAQRKKKKEAVSGVIKEFKLPEKVAAVLEPFSDEPEKLKHAAEVLATAGLAFEDGGSGEDSTPEFDPNRVFKKLGLDD